MKYRFNILEFLKNKKFGALVYGRSRGPRKVVYEARKDFSSDWFWKVRGGAFALLLPEKRVNKNVG